MSKFRKKPVVVDAIQFDGDNQDEVVVWSQELKRAKTDVSQNGDGTLDVETLEGIMHISPRDWVICGVSGELYPCKPEIFAKTYESADGASDIDVHRRAIGFLLCCVSSGENYEGTYDTLIEKMRSELSK